MMRRLPPLFLILVLLLSLTGCRPAAKGEDDLPATLYRIEATLAPERALLSVRTEIEYSAPDELSALKLRLYAGAYAEGNAVVTTDKRDAAYAGGVVKYGAVELLSVRGEPAVTGYDVGQGDTLLTLRLSKKTARGDRVRLCIEEEITLAEIKHRLGAFGGYYSLANFYPEICPFREGKFLSHDYLPYGDPFAFERADFEVSLTLPQGYECAASVWERERIREGASVRYLYTLAGARDFALVASKRLRHIESAEGSVPVRYYCESDPKSAETLAFIRKTIDEYTVLFGAYPYPDHTVVLAPFFEAGVEHSGLSVVSYALSSAARKETILHEIAHQWWFGKVGNDEYLHPWMDEGLAEYAVAALYKRRGENAAYRAKRRAAEDAYAVRLALRGSEGTRFDLPLSDLAEGYYDRVYCGGMILFSALSDRFGEDAFHAALRDYADAYAGCVCTSQDLIRSLSASFDADLAPTFSSWLSASVPMQ